MASILSRLAGIFAGYRPSPVPVETPEQRAARLITAAKDTLDRTARRTAPSTEERVPSGYHAGAAGRVWFLPYQDSVTKDTPEIRAAMRMMRRDGYVRAAFEPQILTVASEDWQIQASEVGNTESEEQAEFVKVVLEEYLSGGIVALVRAVCAPLGSDGFSIAEKVWGHAERGKHEGKIILSALKAKDADYGNGAALRLEGDKFGNVTSVQASRATDQARFPIRDFVYTRYMQVFDEPMGEAVFRPAYSCYWMRDTVRKLRMIHCEKKMAGFLVGTYDSDDDKPGLEAMLARAKSATWAAIPEGVRVEAVQLSTASEPDYKSFDESLRDEIVTAIAFATLQTVQGNIPDARGDSKVQKSMADLGPWLLMALVTDAVNTQIIPDLIDFNFPFVAGPGYPKISFGAVSNQELLELVQIVEAAQRIGLKPSRKHYAKALSIQEADPNDPEDELSAGGQGGGMMGGFGGGMPPTDPFGGMPPDGGGQLPPDGGGGFGGDPAALPPYEPAGEQPEEYDPSGQAFSELYHSFAGWDDWTQVQTSRGPRMRSPSGRRYLTLPTFEKLKGRTAPQTAAAVGGTPVGPLVPAPAVVPPQPDGTRTTVGVPPRPVMPGEPDLGMGLAAVAAAAGGARRRATAAGRAVGREAAKAAKRAGRAVKTTASAAERIAARVGQGMMLGVKYLGRAIEGLGDLLHRVPNLFVGGLGGAGLGFLAGGPVGAAIGGLAGAAAGGAGRGWLTPLKEPLWNLGHKLKVRAGVVANAFKGSALAGKKQLIREVSRAMGVHYKESRRKYGPVLGAAVEATMFGWMVGKAAILGTAGLAAAKALGGVATVAGAGGGVAAGLAAVWAAGKVGTYLEKAFGIGLKPLVRNVAENVARTTSNTIAGRTTRTRNPNAPGRVAQAIEWAEGLSPKKFAKAVRGKGVALWYVTGDNRKTGSGRGGKITAQTAVQWVLKKREIQAADAEGRKPNLPPEEEAIVRRAMQISDEGRWRKLDAEKAFDTATPPPKAPRRKRFGVFAEAGGIDQAELIADLRAAVDDVFAAMGLPPIDATDEELGGSLAVTLALMERRATEAEAFAEEYDAFGWQGARTKGGGIKAVGTAEHQGQTLYGQRARAALARQGGVSGRVRTPRNLEYDVTDQAGNTIRRKDKNVDPEFARQMAIQAAVGDAGAPRNLKVTKARQQAKKKAAEIKAAVQAAEAGDPRAAQALQSHAASMLPAAGEAIRSTPAPSPEVKAELASAVASVMPDVPRETAAKVGGFIAGLHDSASAGPKGLEKAVGNFAGWLGRQPRKILGGILRGLGAVAKGLWRATKWAAPRVGRAVGSLLKSGWAKFAKMAGPFAMWAGGLAAVAAIMAAPVLAVNMGLLPGIKGGLIALASAPVATYAAVKVLKRIGKKSADMGLRNKGYGFLTNKDADAHAEKFSESDVALAGPDGKRAGDLLRAAKDEMTTIFRDKCKRAVTRMLERPNPLASPVLFDDAELSEVAGGLARVIATADLLGRARIRRRAEMAEKSTFAENDDPFHDFAEPVPALTPEKAIEYVRKRVPSVDPGPERYGPRLSRHATTLAIAADNVLLDKIKDAVISELNSGRDATANIDGILDAAGVGPRDPQYGEMLARTNAMEGYNQGANDELLTPDMQEKFPAWRYEGILDDRTGDDHRPHIGKYFPSARAFAEVRGNRIWNCRCVLPGQYIRGNILVGSKARYSGQAVEIETVKGARFSVTPNHPVLTGRGWIAAGDLGEGDYLLNNPREINRLVVGDEVQDRPSRVEDVFGSLPQENALRVFEGWSALDFHGDGPSLDREVEVVTATRSLLIELQTGGLEGIGQLPLGGGHGDQVISPRVGPVDAALERTVGTVPAELDAFALQSQRDGTTGNTVCLAQGKDGLAGRVPCGDLVRRNDLVPSPVDSGADFIARSLEMSPQGVIFDPDASGEVCDRSSALVFGGELGETTNHHRAAGVGSPVDCFAGANLDARRHESPAQRAGRNANATRDAGERLPVGVTNDEVKYVRFFHYSGPVYDFMTSHGYYAIGSDSGSLCVVHNCSFQPIHRSMMDGIQVEE